MIHRADERRRCQHAHARNLLESLRDGMLGRDARELPIDQGDARLKRADFLDDERDGVAEQLRKRDLRVLESGKRNVDRRSS
jgi:hypothetical protein